LLCTQKEQKMNFNYQKSYFTLALPEFNELSKHVREAHTKVCALVKDLQQGRDLNIPLDDSIRGALEPLTTKDIAKLSRSSYFTGHHKPSHVKGPFDNSKGESWKVSNCCDQILRDRLSLPYIEIHNGTLRVFFSGRDTWLWEEFALATEENLQTFKECGLSFNGRTLYTSADILKKQINDVYPDPDSMPDNKEYTDYLLMMKEINNEKIKKRFEERIISINKDIKSLIKKREFLLLCNRLDVPTDNVIYYNHIDTFTFGWREVYNKYKEEEITNKLNSCKDELIKNNYIFDFNKKS
jgi:hypothetical protein